LPSSKDPKDRSEGEWGTVSCKQPVKDDTAIPAKSNKAIEEGEL